MLKNCQKCDKKFTPHLSNLRIGRGKFCSVSCSVKGRKNSNRKGHSLTEEHKRKISETMQGRTPKNINQIKGWNKDKSGYSTSKKGKKYPHIIAWNRGTKGICKPNSSSFKIGRTNLVSEETRKKISFANTGKHLTEETKLKLRLANRGKKLTEETKRKVSQALKGRMPKNIAMLSGWNKGKRGLLVHTAEYKKHMSEIMMGREKSLETRLKLSKANKGKRRSEAQKEKARIYTINHPNKKFKDTSIEVRIEALLKALGVEYQKQVPLHNIAIVDFYIPSKNLVIQCDGCYWHGCPEHFPSAHPEQKQRDTTQDKTLQEKGLIVSRFWEHEIMSLNFNLHLV